MWNVYTNGLKKTNWINFNEQFIMFVCINGLNYLS